MRKARIEKSVRIILRGLGPTISTGALSPYEAINEMSARYKRASEKIALKYIISAAGEMCIVRPLYEDGYSVIYSPSVEEVLRVLGRKPTLYVTELEETEEGGLREYEIKKRYTVRL